MPCDILSTKSSQYPFNNRDINATSARCHHQGFALVIALALMAFILLLILGLSTFVSVEHAQANTLQNQLKARHHQTHHM